MEPDTLKPRMQVRRFDVFAEYNRQKAIAEGRPEDEAAGYGLWVAKVVASRKFGSSFKPPKYEKQGEGKEGEQQAPERPREKWHSLDGEEQTDERFDKEVVRRMGRDFYHKVFEPAIENAVREGYTYQSIRDSIRKEWKP